MDVDNKLIETVNRQFIALDRDAGSDAITSHLIEAIEGTLTDYRGEISRDNLLRELLQLHDMQLRMRPRLASAFYTVQQILVFVGKQDKFDADALRSYLKELEDEHRNLLEKTASVAMSIFDQPRTLLLHAYSRTLNAILCKLAQHENKPERIIVAEQADARTRKVVATLGDVGLPFRVMSEFALSHIVREIDIAILPGLTLDLRGDVIMGPGSANILALLGDVNSCTYTILPTSKWSFWDEKTPSAFIEKSQRTKAGVEYEKQTYSHDEVKLEMLQGIVSEERVLKPEDVRFVYGGLKQQFIQNEMKIADLAREVGMDDMAARLAIQESSAKQAPPEQMPQGSFEPTEEEVGAAPPKREPDHATSGM